MPTPANDAPLEVACPQCSKPVVWSPESAYRRASLIVVGRRESTDSLMGSSESRTSTRGRQGKQPGQSIKR